MTRFAIIRHTSYFILYTSMRDYQLISPSLGGILLHDSIIYEGVRRPTELLRAMDGPSRRGTASYSNKQQVVYTPDEQKIIHEYLIDLHQVFMKKFSQFMVQSDEHTDEGLTLLAMLQELIKVKKLVS